MNRELLARVRDRIAEVGNEHCDMHDYASDRVTANGAPACGTAACIAGWTFAVRYGAFDPCRTKMVREDEPFSRKAMVLLGLPSTALFYVENWPAKYEETAQTEGDAKGMLAVCDALLDGSLSFDADGRLVETEQP